MHWLATVWATLFSALERFFDEASAWCATGDPCRPEDYAPAATVASLSTSVSRVPHRQRKSGRSMPWVYRRPIRKMVMRSSRSSVKRFRLRRTRMRWFRSGHGNSFRGPPRRLRHRVQPSQIPRNRVVRDLALLADRHGCETCGNGAWSAHDVTLTNWGDSPVTVRVGGSCDCQCIFSALCINAHSFALLFGTVSHPPHWAVPRGFKQCSVVRSRIGLLGGTGSPVHGPAGEDVLLMFELFICV
jgi:hypothetical protein